MILDAKITDVKRQIEVAAKISEKNRQLTQYDLACEFGVSEARIRRDVAVLNKEGMDIHSRKGRYSIHAPDELICRLTRWYLLLCETLAPDRQPSDTVKQSATMLSLVIGLGRSISASRLIQIKYKADWKEAAPVALYRYNGDYCLMTICNNAVKVFSLDRIEDIKYLDTKFKMQPLPPPDDIFRNSWSRNKHGKECSVGLRFDKSVLPHVRERFFGDDQVTKMTNKGFEVYFKTRLSYEFISWILGWGKRVTVLEPGELKLTIVQISNEIVETYRAAQTKKNEQPDINQCA